MQDKDLASLSLQEFREFITNQNCDLESVKATLTDKMNSILDEKTSIENQLNAAKARYQLGQERADPKWFSKASGALNHRKRKADKINKMLSLLKDAKKFRVTKIIKESDGLANIDSSKVDAVDNDIISLFFEKVFCDICEEELDTELYKRIKETTKEVIAILKPNSFGEYTEFRSWRQKYLNEGKENYGYKQLAIFYSMANK
jgi:hypothetical protein